MKRLTQDIATKMAEALASNKEFKEFVNNANNKALAETNGTFKFVISDETKDRAGEVVKVDGWELGNYNKNGVVLFAHDYNSMPVGKSTKVYVEGTKLISEGIWAGHEQAQTLRKLYEDGFIKTVSVGFIPKEFDENDSSIITKAELLEYSVVPVPANPNALALAQEKGISTTELMELATKGVFDFSTKDTDQPDDEPTDEDIKEIEAEDETTEDVVDEPKEKGAVADQFNKKTKYKMFRPIDDLFMALVNVYFYDSSTKVDDFKELVTEFGQLCIDVANGKEVKSKMLDIEAVKGMALSKALTLKDAEDADKGDDTEPKDEPMTEHDAVKMLQSVAKDINETLFRGKKERDTKTT